MNISKWVVSKAPVLGSSQNPEEMSLTVKGILIALIPVILGILGYFGIQGTQDMLQNLINAIFGLVSSAMIVWGAIRKFKKQ